MNDPGTGEEPRYGPRVGFKKNKTVYCSFYGIFFVENECSRQFQGPSICVLVCSIHHRTLQTTFVFARLKVLYFQLWFLKKKLAHLGHLCFRGNYQNSTHLR